MSVNKKTSTGSVFDAVVDPVRLDLLALQLRTRELELSMSAIQVSMADLQRTIRLILDGGRR
jgi:hypothetical protein